METWRWELAIPGNDRFFKDHWSYNKMIDTFKMMLGGKNDFACGFPYELSVQEGLLFPEDIESDMLESDFNEIKWSINISVLLKPTEPVACGVCHIVVLTGKL